MEAPAHQSIAATALADGGFRAACLCGETRDRDTAAEAATAILAHIEVARHGSALDSASG